MAKKLTRRKILLAKNEVTYNTDPTPSASTDAVLVENLQWSSAGLKMNARPAVRPSLGELQQVYGGRLLQVTFDAEIKGSGSAGTAPEIGPLLRCCGMDETIVASTSVQYGPVSDSPESATLYIYEDGKRIQMTGCRGTVSFNLPAGDIPRASFTITGHEILQTDTAFTTPVYDSTSPTAYTGGSFSVGGYSAVISALSFDMGITIATPESVNGSDGYDEISIVARDINGTIDPLDTSVADNAWIADFRNGTTGAIATGNIGTAGNQFQVSMPAVYYRDVSMADRDGVAALSIPFGSAETTTDNEVSITFT